MAQEQIGKLSIEVAPEWTKQEMLVIVAPSAAGKYRPNVTITCRGVGKNDIGKIVRDARMGILQQGFPGLRFVADGEYELAGQPAHRFDVTHSVAAKVKGEERKADLKRAHVVSLVDQKVYEISVSVVDDESDSWAAVDAALSEISFGD